MDQKQPALARKKAPRGLRHLPVPIRPSCLCRRLLEMEVEMVLEEHMQRGRGAEHANFVKPLLDLQSGHDSDMNAP